MTDAPTPANRPGRSMRASVRVLGAVGAVTVCFTAMASVASAAGTLRRTDRRAPAAQRSRRVERATSPATKRPIASASPWRSSTPLAVVSGGKLSILRDGTARVVASADPELPLAWSPDGTWLLFRRTSASGSSAAWTVRVDGSQLRPVAATPSSIVAWAGERDLLLVASSAPFATASVVASAAPGGPTHELVRVNGDVQALVGFGDEIAVSTARSAPRLGFESATLELAALGGGAPRVLASSRSASFGPLRFSPDGRSLLYDVDPSNSSSIAADGLDLRVMELTTGRAVDVGTGLVHPDWFSWSGSGAELAVTLGGSRAAWATDKHVVVCTLGNPACAAVARPSGAISFEPDFGAGGRLVYVTAEGLGGKDGFGAGAPFGTGNGAIDRWTATFRLRVLGAGPAAAISDVSGASAPEWIDGGPGLLFVRSGALWYDASAAASPVRVTAAVLTTGFGYYGSLDWSAEYALAR